jgi:hypothetical protein
MAKISHTKIKQSSFGEKKRPKLTYIEISRFTVPETLRFCVKQQSLTHSFRPREGVVMVA